MNAGRGGSAARASRKRQIGMPGRKPGMAGAPGWSAAVVGEWDGRRQCSDLIGWVPIRWWERLISAWRKIIDADLKIAAAAKS
jgi:hypothetical protein